MKHIFLMLVIIFLLGCGGDDPVNVKTASRSVADYMYDGPVGTEYWMREERNHTYANGKTELKRDTIVLTILNRAYNHPILGNCIQAKFEGSPLYAIFLDTVYCAMSNNTIVVTSSNSKTIQKLFTGPIEEGTLQDVGELDEGGVGISKIHALDVPITTPAGNFTTIHVRSETSYSKDKIIEDTYFTQGVLVSKSETLYDRVNLKGEKELKKVTTELFLIKKP